MHRGQEVACSLVVMRSNPAERLDFPEETLDKIVLLIVLTTRLTRISHKA